MWRFVIQMWNKNGQTANIVEYTCIQLKDGQVLEFRESNKLIPARQIISFWLRLKFSKLCWTHPHIFSFIVIRERNITTQMLRLFPPVF